MHKCTVSFVIIWLTILVIVLSFCDRFLLTVQAGLELFLTASLSWEKAS